MTDEQNQQDEPVEAPEAPELDPDQDSDTDAEPTQEDGDESTDSPSDEPSDDGEDGEEQSDGDLSGSDYDPDSPEGYAPMDDKAIEKMYDKLAREDERHRNRVSEVVGDDAVHLLNCPMCKHFTAGWFPDPNAMPWPEENVLLMRSLLGMPDLSNLETSPNITKCPTCNGKGRVKTGSAVPGYESYDCETCNQRGWVMLRPSPRLEAADGDGAPTEIITGPTVYTDDDDPQVKSLRERGFLVVAPSPQLAAANSV